MMEAWTETLGGIGSLSLALLGGGLTGILAKVVKLGAYSGGQNVLIFMMLTVVLLAKPAGLLGKAGIEKV